MCGLETDLVIFWQRLWLPFCSHPKCLWEAKLKSYGLTALAEVIFRLPITDCVVWLLVAILTKIYTENGQASQEKVYSVHQEVKTE